MHIKNKELKTKF